MHTTDQQILEYNGWTLECESPLEIRHAQTGSFASGLAATAVIAELRSQVPDHPADSQQISDLADLAALCDLTCVIAEAAEKSEQADPWKDAYSLVFSDELSGRIFAMQSELRVGFTFNDPDSSYRGDVMAFVAAVKELKQSIATRQIAVVFASHFGRKD